MVELKGRKTVYGLIMAAFFVMLLLPCTKTCAQETKDIKVTVVSGGESVIWANGNPKHKYVQLKTKLTPTDYVKNKRTIKGKIRWIICKEKTTPVLTDHVLKTKSNASKLASISTNGKVAAKSGGMVYAYAIDIGSGNVEEFTITVKNAPYSMQLYTNAETKEAVKSLYINTVDDTKIYVDAKTISAKTKIDPESTFTVKPLKKAMGENFTVSDMTCDKDGNWYFTMKAKEVPTKSYYYVFRVYNEQNGQYVSVRVYVANPVTDIYAVGSGKILKKGDKVTVNLELITKDKTQPTSDKLTLLVVKESPKMSSSKKTYTYKSSKLVKATLSKDHKTIELEALKDITEQVKVLLMITDTESKVISERTIAILLPAKTE
ncbi:MAG: hypothetical protein K5858_07855 [Lachnospiraceae bacterium]|nr:hypothetical protein [Lachnospiraceae bacterium]